MYKKNFRITGLQKQNAFHTINIRINIYIKEKEKKSEGKLPKCEIKIFPKPGKNFAGQVEFC